MKKANAAIYIPNMDADSFDKICNEKGLQFVYVPVPPHGRLIDADALGDFPYNMDFCDGGEADEWIRNAPTIIEAEEGE